MRYKKILLKAITLIGENLLNKKTTPSINIPSSSKVGTTRLLVYQGKALIIPTAHKANCKVIIESNCWPQFNLERISLFLMRVISTHYIAL